MTMHSPPSSESVARGSMLGEQVQICSDRILTFGIRSIRSPAKVGLVVTELLITSPVVSWRGWETTPPPPPKHSSSAVILCSITVEGRPGLSP